MSNTTDRLSLPYIDPSWPFQLFSECLSIPTLILFIILSYQHYKKGFNGTFQKLVYITILNDMWCYYNQMFFIRWPQMGIFGFYLSLSPTIIPAFFAYFALVSVYHQHFFVLLIAINRMHSLFSPLKFNLFWDDNFSKLILFLFVLPQPFCGYVIFSDRVYYVQTALDTGFLYSKGMAGIAGKCILYGTVVIAIVTGIFNILTIMKLLTWQNERLMKREVNMKFHFYSLYTFVVCTMYNLTEFGVFVSVYGSFWSKFCTISSNVLIDLFCLSSVWTWLLMSSDARHLIRRRTNVADVSVFILNEKTRGRETGH